MKVFISYSRQDHIFRDEILKILSILEQNDTIKFWVDYREIKGGDLFDEKIEKEIESSDVFLLLLSQNFWDSEYIQQKELPDILKSHRKKQTKVLPIILKENDDYLDYIQLKKFSAIPQANEGLKPLISYDSKEEGYQIILNEVKKIIFAQDIRSNLHILFLSRHALNMLSPYTTFNELEIDPKNIIFNNENKSWYIEFNEYYENKKSPVLKSLTLNYNEEEKKLFGEYFRNIYFL